MTRSGTFVLHALCVGSGDYFPGRARWAHLSTGVNNVNVTSECENRRYTIIENMHTLTKAYRHIWLPVSVINH